MAVEINLYEISVINILNELWKKRFVLRLTKHFMVLFCNEFNKCNNEKEHIC